MILAMMSLSVSYAQNFNWSSLEEDQKQMAYINFGFDYGVTAQFGYAHKADIFTPVIISFDYSMPMGKDLVDDFKMRLGFQKVVFQKNNFMLTTKVYGNFRRHQTQLVRMMSFGSEISGVVGYYKSRWHLAMEVGFDKAIATHLKQGAEMKENYGGIQDGWFVPTGGNLFCGLQTSKTLGKTKELSLRLGILDAQFDDEDPLLPIYLQLGFVCKL